MRYTFNMLIFYYKHHSLTIFCGVKNWCLFFGGVYTPKQLIRKGLEKKMKMTDKFL